MINVLIADDDILVRDGLKILIDSEDDMKVVSVAKNGLEAFQLAQKHRPDVVLMDIRMPDIDGIRGTQLINENGLDTKVLMLTTFKDDEYIVSALKNGANGYMLKNQSSDEIIDGIRTVQNGTNIYGEEIAQKLKELIGRKKDKINPDTLSLSNRELGVLRLIANGLNNKEIAATMFISDGTVRNYVSTLLDKLDLRDRTQLAIFYIRHIE